MNYKGEIKDFPQEVVEWMLDQQEKQGNKRDVSVFEEDGCIDVCNGGFEWDRTNDGVDFCGEVIWMENFDLLFQRYPKEEIVELTLQDISEGKGKGVPTHLNRIKE